MRYFLGFFLFVVVATVSFLGVRGTRFTQPPIIVFPDMDYQAKYKPQGSNAFFADGRNDRPVIPGTVDRGKGWDIKEVFSAEYGYPVAANPVLFSGRTDDGEYATAFPIPVTNELMAAGQQKFQIFCQVCHGQVGDGNGITKSYGMALTPSLIDQRLREMPNGQIFETITNGKGVMGAYGYSLRPEERWAIIAYIRALQLAGNATVDDVPQNFRPQLGL